MSRNLDISPGLGEACSCTGSPTRFEETSVHEPPLGPPAGPPPQPAWQSANPPGAAYPPGPPASPPSPAAPAPMRLVVHLGWEAVLALVTVILLVVVATTSPDG